jgi:hypothetical protein
MRLVAAALVVLGGSGVLLNASAETSHGIVHRFLQSTGPPLETYVARRTLEASTMGGRMQAKVQAWTRVDEDGIFRFDVISESGSALIREHVLVEALETEQRTHNQRDTVNVELRPENYQFKERPGGAGHLASITLLPRRQSPMLLNGVITVKRENGDIVSLQGSPSKSPSWWTRKVEIAQRYERINGVRVPIELSSRADVRVAGDSTFLMTYDYVTINGRSARSPRP